MLRVLAFRAWAIVLPDQLTSSFSAMDGSTLDLFGGWAVMEIRADAALDGSPTFAEPAATLAREFVARIGRLASGEGWRRRTTPPMALDLPCRSRPMLLAATISRSSGAG